MENSTSQRLFDLQFANAFLKILIMLKNIACFMYKNIFIEISEDFFTQNLLFLKKKEIFFNAKETPLIINYIKYKLYFCQKIFRILLANLKKKPNRFLQNFLQTNY